MHIEATSSNIRVGDHDRQIYASMTGDHDAASGRHHRRVLHRVPPRSALQLHGLRRHHPSHRLCHHRCRRPPPSRLQTSTSTAPSPSSSPSAATLALAFLRRHPCLCLPPLPVGLSSCSRFHPPGQGRSCPLLSGSADPDGFVQIQLESLFNIVSQR
jgi:hypothetical protein